jgi:hypothetical protein
LRDAWLTRSEVEQHLEQRTLFDRNGKITSIPQLQRTQRSSVVSDTRRPETGSMKKRSVLDELIANQKLKSPGHQILSAKKVHGAG